jgi:hypothetical protein
VTRAHIDVGGGYGGADLPQALLMAGGDAVALRGDHRLTLSVGEQYRIVQDGDGWRVETAAYFYAVGQQRAGELLAYHWHPQGRGRVVDPHLHVNADARGDVGWIGKLHLPTGHVELPDVIQIVIEELGARPIREDWAAVLHEARRPRS